MIFGSGVYGASAYASGNKITTPAEKPIPPAAQTILNYYASLIIRQYKTLVKANAMVQLLCNQSVTDGFIFDEQTCFDIDTAVGAQLDILGRIVGVTRRCYSFDLSHTYMNYTDYDSNPSVIAGYGDYNDSPFDPSGFLFYQYEDFDSIRILLSDDDMRSLIKMKIELNNSSATFAFIKSFIYRYLNTDVAVVDNKDMSITYTIHHSFGSLARAALFNGMLPAPMGVQTNYIFQ